MTQDTLIPISIAGLGILILQIGLIIQKRSLHNTFSKILLITPSFKYKYSLRSLSYWGMGTLLTVVGAFFGFYAISISEVSIVQPLIGIGPIILAILLTVFFKEKFPLKLWLAVFLSALGVYFLSNGPINLNPLPLELYDQNLVLISFVMGIFIVIVAFALTTVKLPEGVYGGVIGGILGGLPPLYARIAIPKLTQLTFHWTLFALLLTQFLSFVFLQKGIYHGKLPMVTSIFMAVSIFVPVILAVLWLAESISIFHIIGISLILAGVIYFLYKNPSTGNLLPITVQQENSMEKPMETIANL